VDTPSSGHSHRRTRAQTNFYNNYWNEEDFSADELFNLFFGASYSNQASQRRRHPGTNYSSSSQANFAFSNTVCLGL
jgi:hypothetical protein